MVWDERDYPQEVVRAYFWRAAIWIAVLLAVLTAVFFLGVASAATIPVLDARDASGQTVIVRCESPMSRILVGGEAAMVCTLSAEVFRSGFE